MSKLRHTAILNAVGLIVLLIGIGSAGLIYWSGQKPPAPETTTGEWKDGSLSLTESKTATRNIELFGGKLEVLMVQWQERLQRPTSIAIITGAAGGLGRATAIQFVKEGAKLGLIDIGDCHLS